MLNLKQHTLPTTVGYVYMLNVRIKLCVKLNFKRCAVKEQSVNFKHSMLCISWCIDSKTAFCYIIVVNKQCLLYVNLKMFSLLSPYSLEVNEFLGIIISYVWA